MQLWCEITDRLALEKRAVVERLPHRNSSKRTSTKHGCLSIFALHVYIARVTQRTACSSNAVQTVDWPIQSSCISTIASPRGANQVYKILVNDSNTAALHGSQLTQVARGIAGRANVRRASLCICSNDVCSYCSYSLQFPRNKFSHLLAHF